MTDRRVDTSQTTHTCPIFILRLVACDIHVPKPNVLSIAMQQPIYRHASFRMYLATNVKSYSLQHSRRIQHHGGVLAVLTLTAPLLHPFPRSDGKMKVVGLLLATLYFLWLGSLVFRSFTHIESMNSEYIFIMVITLVTIVGTMSAVYTGALAPDQVMVGQMLENHVDVNECSAFSFKSESRVRWRSVEVSVSST